MSKNKRFEVDGANMAQLWLSKRVVFTNLGTTADFLGPKFPGCIITVEEHKEIAQASYDEIIRTLYGLSKEQPPMITS